MYITGNFCKCAIKIIQQPSGGPGDKHKVYEDSKSFQLIVWSAEENETMSTMGMLLQFLDGGCLVPGLNTTVCVNRI